jgi:hypothetical protein
MGRYFVLTVVLNARTKNFYARRMMYSRFVRRASKICALAAAAAALPIFAYAGTDNGQGNGGQNNGNQNGHHKNVPAVPEANAGWVLVPLVGAILLYSSWRQFSRAKASH